MAEPIAFRLQLGRLLGALVLELQHLHQRRLARAKLSLHRLRSGFQPREVLLADDHNLVHQRRPKHGLGQLPAEDLELILRVCRLRR